MLLTQIENLTDTRNIMDIGMELEKRFQGTLLYLKSPRNSTFLIFDNLIGSDLYFTDIKNNISHHINIQHRNDVEIEIPKLKKGYYLHKDLKTTQVSYVTKKAFRQWKRSICKSTYTLESLSEYVAQNVIFSKITSTQHFMQTMVEILYYNLNNYYTDRQNLSNIDLKEHFATNNFLLLSTDFLLIRSLNTLDTFDLLYHKAWVGHTKDLETLTIIDPIFKQEIYDMLSTTNIPLRIKND